MQLYHSLVSGFNKFSIKFFNSEDIFLILLKIPQKEFLSLISFLKYGSSYLAFEKGRLLYVNTNKITPKAKESIF